MELHVSEELTVRSHYNDELAYGTHYAYRTRQGREPYDIFFSLLGASFFFACRQRLVNALRMQSLVLYYQ